MTHGGAHKKTKNDDPILRSDLSSSDVGVQQGSGLHHQLIVGNHTQTYSYSYNVAHGGVLNVAASPTVVPRPRPQNLKPRPLAQLIGRQNGLVVSRKALQHSRPIEIFAAPGMGKTAILRRLAHDDEVTTQFPAGVVYLSVHQQPVDDAIQSLYDVFYQARPPLKPNRGQLQQALKQEKALVILNELSWTVQEMERLLSAMPGCTFVLASTTRRYWLEGTAIALEGLSFSDATTLLQKELGRPLAEAEQPAAKRLWQALAGNPLQLKRAAAQAQTLAQESAESTESNGERDKRKNQALIGLVKAMPMSNNASETQQALFQMMTPRLSKTQTAALSLLGAMAGVGLSEQQVQAITQAPKTLFNLNQLSALHLVEKTDDKYRVCADIIALVQQQLEPQHWLRQATRYFIKQGTNNLAQAHNSAAMMHLLAWTQHTEQWQQSLALVYRLDRQLAMSAQWSQWKQALSHGLWAAEQLEDSQAEAWSMHQLGTRSLGLGNLAQAIPLLSQAVRIRTRLGDSEGAAISQHNLSLIAPPPKPIPNPSSPPTVKKRAPSPISIGVSHFRRWLLVSSVIGGMLLAGMVGQRMLLRASSDEPKQSVVLPSSRTDQGSDLSLSSPSKAQSDDSSRSDTTQAAENPVTQNPTTENTTTLDDFFGRGLPQSTAQTAKENSATEPVSNHRETNYQRLWARTPEPTDKPKQIDDPPAPIIDESEGISMGEETPVLETAPSPSPRGIQKPPTVQDYSFTIQSGDPLTVDLLAGASDPNPDDIVQLSEVSTAAVGGTLTNNGDGTVTYRPREATAAKPIGAYTNTFQFVVTDGKGSFADGTLSIRVKIPQPIP